jgi:hypothetical protein
VAEKRVERVWVVLGHRLWPFRGATAITGLLERCESAGRLEERERGELSSFGGQKESFASVEVLAVGVGVSDCASACRASAITADWKDPKGKRA